MQIWVQIKPKNADLVSIPIKKKWKFGFNSTQICIYFIWIQPKKSYLNWNRTRYVNLIWIRTQVCIFKIWFSVEYEHVRKIVFSIYSTEKNKRRSNNVANNNMFKQMDTNNYVNSTNNIISKLMSALKLFFKK